MTEKQGFTALRSYPLLDAIRNRRSRRFALGAEMPGGGLAYKSTQSVVPLSTLEEAVLVFGAVGLTGFCLGELPFQSSAPESGGGNVMASLRGRTIASADAVHTTILFVTN